MAIMTRIMYVATISVAVAFLPHQAEAFSSTTGFRTSPRTSSRRNRPLNAFEVMPEVEAVVQSTQAMSAVTAVAIPSSASVSSAINSFFQTQPYLAAFLTCSFKASAADIVAQTQGGQQQSDEEGINVPATEPDVDISRNMGFLLYGGIYQGMAQNYLYSVVYPALVGDGQGWGITATKVMVDNLFFAPLLCLPIAYIFKTAFTSDELNMNTLTQSIEKYVYDVMNNGLLVKYWSLWIPAQFITFGVIPEQFRVAFVAFISFFWICILSSVVSSNQQPQPEKLSQ
jgi:hypothetical protein